MGKALGFDLGSAYTALCFQDEKDIKMMASAIALSKKEKLIKASGNEAKSMIGRAPNTIAIERPIKSGYVDGSYVDAKGVKALASIPSREVLYAKLAGAMNSIIGGLAIALKAVADKNEQNA